MPKIKSMLGERFGRLVVVEFHSLVNGKGALWKCRCDCGNERVICGATLRCGHTTSCGCWKKDASRLPRNERRMRARAVGRKRFLGERCKYGHDGTRFVSNGACVHCHHERINRARLENTDCERASATERRRVWKEKNPGRDTKVATLRRQNDGGKYRAYSREYTRRRDALKRLATPPWVDKAELKKIRAECPPGFHVDHILPLMGNGFIGLHVPWNLQYLLAAENHRKSNKVIP